MHYSTPCNLLCFKLYKNDDYIEPTWDNWSIDYNRQLQLLNWFLTNNCLDMTCAIKHLPYLVNISKDILLASASV